MTLPATITPSVSPDAIRRVGRFFDGGPAAVLAETLQNARRACANHMSDDYAIVSIDDVKPLEELDLMPEGEPSPRQENGDRRALRKALKFVVLFLAFDGRDRGCVCMGRSLASLSAMARDAGRCIRAALRSCPGATQDPLHSDLFTRVRAALDDPAALSDTGRHTLIKDLDAAHHLVETLKPRSVHVAAVQHDLGYDVFAAFGREPLDHMVADFCRERWVDTGDARDSATLDDATVTGIWFDNDQTELKTMEIVDPNCSPVDAIAQEAH